MKALKKNILLLICFLLGATGNLYAQRTLIDVTIDEPAILIGEQTVLHLTITANPERPVHMLISPDTIMRGVEVLTFSKPDSSLIENNRLIIKQDILITSFDSALYLLPPFKIVDGVDTIFSNQVSLKVSTVPVDVDNPEQFFDIKEVWKPPFVWTDYLPIILIVLAVIILALAGYYIYKRMKEKKSLIPFKKAEVILPPHEQAILELDEIKRQKIWQQGRIKEYYTMIADTLRRYMEGRFGVNAMEMTSGEILAFIRRESEADSVYENLKQILQLSDLVKFAKWHPLPDENDLSLMNAYLFVNQTKIVEVPSPEEAAKEEDSDETENKLTKNVE